MARRRPKPPKKRRAVARRSPSPQNTDPQEIEGISSEFVYEEEYSTGPIPGPNMLARYNERVPGSGDALLREMQMNGAMRRRTTSWIAFANAFGFVVSNSAAALSDVGAVAGGIFLLYLDKPVEGFALLIGEIAVLRWGKRK